MFILSIYFDLKAAVVLVFARVIFVNGVGTMRTDGTVNISVFIYTETFLQSLSLMALCELQSNTILECIYIKV